MVGEVPSFSPLAFPPFFSYVNVSAVKCIKIINLLLEHFLCMPVSIPPSMPPLTGLQSYIIFCLGIFLY